MKDTQQAKVLAITGMASIPFVMPNIAADVEGHVISENGLIAFVEAVEKGETAIAALADAEAKLNTATADLTTANASLATNQTSLQAANDKVAELEAKIVTLEAQDGGSFSEANSLYDAEGNFNENFKCEATVQAEKLRAQ